MELNSLPGNAENTRRAMNHLLHIAITRKVRPGCEPAFEEAIRRFFASSFSHAGTLGAYLLRPLPGSSDRTYGILRSFANESDRDAFYVSDEFDQWQRTVAPLVEAEYSRRPLHGLEAFFREGPQGSHPPRWKMALLTLAGVYPCVYIFSRTLHPITNTWPPAMAIFITSVMVVSALAWVVMPLLTRIFSFWLYERLTSR
jgi:antibiotic biosynthesis monooxygenase (ABM) superfamily enzyme